MSTDRQAGSNPGSGQRNIDPDELVETVREMYASGAVVKTGGVAPRDVGERMGFHGGSILSRARQDSRIEVVVGVCEDSGAIHTLLPAEAEKHSLYKSTDERYQEQHRND